jgi:two-component system phosphate regulon sensor histidine kinase PhoR
LVWQISPSYILIAVFSLGAVAWYTSGSVREFYLEKTSQDLEARARLVRSRITLPIRSFDHAPIDGLCKTLGRESRTGITIVLVDGTVVGDSEADPLRMENHGDRPEIRAAFAGGTGSVVRSAAANEPGVMYVAIPVFDGSRPVAAVRTAIPMSGVDEALGRFYRRIAFGGVLAALLAVLVGYVISRRISRPLNALTHGARRFAEGELNTPLATTASEEIDALASAMNAMAGQMSERIRAVELQKNQEAAVLGSMSESVFAVDADERLIRINTAAARLFAIDGANVIGRPIHEVVRNHELIRLVGEALASDRPVEGEITIERPDERHLQVHGTVLRGANGSRYGALVVLNDVTRLRRLERVRRDFVANVSHELRTPITTIKGFVETLQAGAINNRRDAERFLDIIANHTERLSAIIEDLLALSWLEQDREAEQITREKTPLRSVVARAVEMCSINAQNRKIEIMVRGADPVEAIVNGPLVERALVNLIDNAIKYSDEGSTVQVEIGEEDARCVIRVIDHGCGIDKRHLPRIFERFYRTDQARSRGQGGTGLGLAIVKHIALLHGGTVSVESKLGVGSTFSMHLPRA